jgi:hypothetical protein
VAVTYAYALSLAFAAGPFDASGKKDSHSCNFAVGGITLSDFLEVAEGFWGVLRVADAGSLPEPFWCLFFLLQSLGSPSLQPYWWFLKTPKEIEIY